MVKSKSIITEKAEHGAALFAKERRHSMNDPIIKTMRNGLRMAFGRVARLNRIAAEKAREQPSLFDAPAQTPLQSQRDANLSAQENV